ncbi:MAG: universal stress protein [Methanomassiliicoccales archaeon]
MFERMLVPIDFSQQSIRMFECISRFSEGREGEMILLNVTEKGEGPTPQQRRTANELVGKASIGGRKARFLKVPGDPVEGILRTAREEGATLIAMASSGKGMAREFFMGSTSLGVVRRSNLPVLIEKFKVSEGKKVEEVCSDLLMRAVVPLDLHGCTERMVARLPELSSQGLKEAVLFHVVDSTRYSVDNDEHFRWVKDRLEGIKEELSNLDCEITTHLHYGSRAYNIMEAAREFQASLIVLGTHGKSLLREMALGSVSEEVVRKSTTSLLIVRC